MNRILPLALVSVSFAFSQFAGAQNFDFRTTCRSGEHGGETAFEVTVSQNGWNRELQAVGYRIHGNHSLVSRFEARCEGEHFDHRNFNCHGNFGGVETSFRKEGDEIHLDIRGDGGRRNEVYRCD